MERLWLENCIVLAIDMCTLLASHLVISILDKDGLLYHLRIKESQQWTRQWPGNKAPRVPGVATCSSRLRLLFSNKFYKSTHLKTGQQAFVNALKSHITKGGSCHGRGWTWGFPRASAVVPLLLCKLSYWCTHSLVTWKALTKSRQI